MDRKAYNKLDKQSIRVIIAALDKIEIDELNKKYYHYPDCHYESVQLSQKQKWPKISTRYTKTYKETVEYRELNKIINKEMRKNYGAYNNNVIEM